MYHTTPKKYYYIKVYVYKLVIPYHTIQGARARPEGNPVFNGHVAHCLLTLLDHHICDCIAVPNHRYGMVWLSILF